MAGVALSVEQFGETSPMLDVVPYEMPFSAIMLAFHEIVAVVDVRLLTTTLLTVGARLTAMVADPDIAEFC
jgi:hypothetical protein